MMKLKNATNVLPHFFRILPYLTVFFASLYLPKDPDLGWHLKYGEYFFQYHQILRTNIFSTMMPNYQWANGSWGTDILTYAIYHAFGFLGLTLAAAVIVTMTFFFFARAAQFGFFEESLFFPALLFLESPLNSTSFRGQQISLLFLGILFYILHRYKAVSKILFFVPILFLIWCNMQEESFLGLSLFFLWTLLTLIKSFYFAKGTEQKNNFRKEIKYLSSIFGLTFAATIINLFGIQIHLVALSHVTDPLLQSVSEYVPFQLFSAGWLLDFVILIILTSWSIYLFINKKFMRHFSLILLPLLLIILSFFIRRFVWPGYYLALPAFAVLVQLLFQRINKFQTVAAVIISVISLFFVLQIKLPLDQFTTMSWDTYCSLQEVPCSPKSANFLLSHKLTKNLFTYYDWGGWLIWNYPDVKPSIDGRMHVWKDTNGYSAAEEYSEYVTGQKSIDASSFDIVYLPNDNSPLANELAKLVQQKKWQSVYEDDYAGIVVRINKK